MRYLEYLLTTGKIVSEVQSDGEITPSEGCGLLEIEDDLIIDTNNFVVRNGVLVKSFETAAERRERERLRQEQAQRSRERLRALKEEFIWALIFGDTDEQAKLSAEATKLKALI